MVSSGRWERTPEERAELVAKARAWAGTQSAFAAVHGVSQPTVSKWLSTAPPTTRPEVHTPRQALVRRPPTVPTMLEVVPVAPRPAPVPTAVPAGSTRLMLGDGVALIFDILPPASWVAEFAAELRRC